MKCKFHKCKVNSQTAEGCLSVILYYRHKMLLFHALPSWVDEEPMLTRIFSPKASRNNHWMNDKQDKWCKSILCWCSPWSFVSLVDILIYRDGLINTIYLADTNTLSFLFHISIQYHLHLLNSGNLVYWLSSAPQLYKALTNDTECIAYFQRFPNSPILNRRPGLIMA